MSLLSAILMLVVSLALTGAGSLFLLNETRLTERAVSQVQAVGAAEVEIAHALESWDARAATPLGGGLFLVERGGVGLLVHLRPPAFPEAGLVSGGHVTLGPGAIIEGAVDSLASGPGLTGDLDLGRVAAAAEQTLPGGSYGSLPSGPADGVIHVRGDMELRGGDGSGVLLVDGNVTLRGPVTFKGVVLVRGALMVSGNGPPSVHLYGSVVTFIAATGDSTMRITYSKAIVDNVLSRFGTPRKLRRMSWTRLSQMG
ncbi:MAG TPA: hypothetical protein VH163_06790 [Gemmatimonadales bacterium]|nr:hypothetical protein [Gemmatimonadales bacterium]